MASPRGTSLLPIRLGSQNYGLATTFRARPARGAEITLE
ncbi:hypothetical protein TMEN_736 [Trichophyton mentagrophytes]|nr:hypothetical protein TMEN_736 [Trichophyton mentagrophytes]